MTVRVVGDEVGAVVVGRHELVRPAVAGRAPLPDAAAHVLERHLGPIGEDGGHALGERAPRPDGPLRERPRASVPDGCRARSAGRDRRRRRRCRAGHRWARHRDSFTCRMWTGSVKASSRTKLWSAQVQCAPREQLFDLERLARLDAPDAGVEVHHRLAHGVRVDVGDDDDRVGCARWATASAPRCLEYTRIASSSLQWTLKLRSWPSAGCARRISLSRVRYGASESPRLRAPAQSRDLVLVLLVVDVLFATRAARRSRTARSRRTPRRSARRSRRSPRGSCTPDGRRTAGTR